MLKKNIRLNLWPLAIIGLLSFGVVLTVWTIKVASKNPTYMDSAYLTDYRNVDNNINEYMHQQNLFDSTYMVDVENAHLSISNKNIVSIKIIDQNLTAITDANVTALITRPHTTALDFKVPMKHTEEGEYMSDKFEIKEKGRWEIIYQIEVGNLKAYKKVKLKNVGL